MFSNSSWENADEMAQLIQILGEAPPELAPAARRFYQPELDGLRFYAFLGVFVYHTLPSQTLRTARGRTLTRDGAVQLANSRRGSPELAPAAQRGSTSRSLTDCGSTHFLASLSITPCPSQTLFYRRLHLPLPTCVVIAVRPKSGASGVDLFFALSAFLITSLLLRERQDTGDISLRLFYLRRILRIWPLYFVVVALGIVLAHTMANQSLPWYYIAGYLLFVGNWISAVFGHTQSICSPLWTVSIEEQFYLLWPALLKVLQRRGIVIAAITTIVLATLSQVGIVLTGVGWVLPLLRQRVALLLLFAMGILLGWRRRPSAHAYEWLPFHVSSRWDWRMGFRSGPAYRSAGRPRYARGVGTPDNLLRIGGDSVWLLVQLEPSPCRRCCGTTGQD